MEYNVQIDDEQEHKFIRPIFEALAANVNDETLMKIYLDTKIAQFCTYLPDRVYSNPEFVKKAIDLDLLDYSRVPSSLKNSSFISKEDYVKLVAARQIDIEGTMYPQDKDIVLAGIKGVYIFNTIRGEFRQDLPFMVECIKKEERIFHYLPENQKQEILNNKKYLTNILSGNKQFFHKINETDKTDNEVLRVMLGTKEGYGILRHEDLIRKITDGQTVLEALRVNPDIKLIHQKFSSVIKKHGAKADAYNFLKTYLVMQSLDKDLDNNPKQPPVKNI